MTTEPAASPGPRPGARLRRLAGRALAGYLAFSMLVGVGFLGKQALRRDRPVRSRPSSAMRMPERAIWEPSMSAPGREGITGSPPSSRHRSVKPARAWMLRSWAGRWR